MLIILVQSFIAIETIPEIHVLTPAQYLKQIQEFSELYPASSEIGSLEMHEYHNAQIGKYLCAYILIANLAILVLLIFALAGTRKTSKKAASL